jgi:hypothetical protein
MYADHVAVWLFSSGQFASLTLHLPCQWNDTHQRFVQSPTNPRCPGSVLNARHDHFQNLTGINSLANLQHVMDRGAVCYTHSGFHARAQPLGQSNHLLSLTFGINSPNSPGTKFIWDHCPNQRTHLSLIELVPDTLSECQDQDQDSYEPLDYNMDNIETDDIDQSVHHFI